MPRIVFATKDMIYEGSDAKYVNGLPASPFNFISEDTQALYQISLPFSMSITTTDLDSDFPFKLTLISPGYYLYTELARDEYIQNVLNRGQHMHNTYEIVYTRQGEFYQQIEANRYCYKEGTCFILNRNVRHKEEYTSNFSIVTLSLSPDFLLNTLNDSFSSSFTGPNLDWLGGSEVKDFFDAELNGAESEKKRYLNFIPHTSGEGYTDKIRSFFDQLVSIISSPIPGGSHEFKAIICQILAELGNDNDYSTRLYHIGSNTESKIFAKITALMEEHNGRLTRSELIKLTNYSGSYLNKIVQKYSGRSLSQYGYYFSMKEAARLLKSTDLTIEEIALQIGFSDRTHFYALFRQEYGITPRQYRLEK